MLHKKMKFSIKNFFSKCDQIRRKLRIWSQEILNGKRHFLYNQKHTFSKSVAHKSLISQSLMTRKSYEICRFFLVLTVLYLGPYHISMIERL